MVRRSFRIGLWIGLVLGVTLALRRTVQLRRSAEHPDVSPEPWPPLRFGEDRTEAGDTTPFPAVPRSETGPVAAAALARNRDEEPPLEEAVLEEVRIEESLRSRAEPAPAGAAAASQAGEFDDYWSVPEIEEARPRAARSAKKAAGPGKATAKKAPRPKKAAMAWVEADEGACPTSHPIKAKLGSGIFHLPGMFAYDRTKADRCYARAEDAEADGLHRAKR